MRNKNEKNSNKVSISSSHLESSFGNEPVGKKKSKGLDTQCCLHIHSKRYRLADTDGICAKYFIDGLIKAGILRNDTTKEIKQITFSQEKISKNEMEETILTIEIE